MNLAHTAPRWIALAWAAATCCSTVLAQSTPAPANVTLYGLMDVGIEYRSNNNAAGNNQWRVNSGGLNTSRLGLRGQEDLGNGLSARFNLEGEVGADTGAADTSAFWGRQAWVGLDSKSMGAVSLGRMSTVAYDFTIGHDFMGFAPQYSWVTASASVPKDGFTSRISNAVRYVGKFGSLKVGANLGLGEVAGSLNANTTRGLSVAYDEGAVSAQISLDDGRTAATETNTTSTSNRSVIASGTYSLGGAKLYAGVRDTQRKPVGAISPTTQYHNTLYWLGASAPVTDAITAYGGVYVVNKAGDSDPMMLTAKLHYTFSKRTLAYATAAIARASSDNGVGTLTGVYRDQTPASHHQSGVGVGVQHRF